MARNSELGRRRGRFTYVHTATRPSPMSIAGSSISWSPAFGSAFQTHGLERRGAGGAERHNGRRSTPRCAGGGPYRPWVAKSPRLGRGSLAVSLCASAPSIILADCLHGFSL